ncbi:stem-specific TSJT1-like protein [Medicago truncatula]|uniref:Stem-specific TSJT1-like protein n=1 Tax=Medicago truncatula TaxID=3880 RepID=A0A072VDE4_MEDTR|nr:stem-specific TSJT1-like protein [Medicago truncatula]
MKFSPHEKQLDCPRTLRDSGPYPPDQVAKELDGSFAFVVYDSIVGTVFSALLYLLLYHGSDGGLKLY